LCEHGLFSGEVAGDPYSGSTAAWSPGFRYNSTSCSFQSGRPSSAGAVLAAAARTSTCAAAAALPAAVPGFWSPQKQRRHHAPPPAAAAGGAGPWHGSDVGRSCDFGGYRSLLTTSSVVSRQRPTSAAAGGSRWLLQDAYQECRREVVQQQAIAAEAATLASETRALAAALHCVRGLMD
jgi:hypothetical protein